MMIRLLPLPSSSSSSLLFESLDLPRPKSSRTTTICSSSRSHNSIPKLEPFSRSKIDRGVEEPSFIEKSENQLAEYCSTLEGDRSYSCWSAYFELKDLEKELPKGDVEKLVRETQGVKSLIECVHGVSAAVHRNKNGKYMGSGVKVSEFEKEHLPVPDGLPKTKEELDEEEKARMPDSPYTRMLRTKSRMPAWYSLVPDHETD